VQGTGRIVLKGRNSTAQPKERYEVKLRRNQQTTETTQNYELKTSRKLQ